MAREQFHAGEKIVQQMSRDGLVEENLVQNTVKNVSSRQADYMLEKELPPEQAHDRNQNRDYYSPQENADVSLSTTEADTEYAAFKERIRHIREPEPVKAPTETDTEVSKQEPVTDEQGQKLKEKKRYRKSERTRRYDAEDAESEDDAEESENKQNKAEEKEREEKPVTKDGYRNNQFSKRLKEDKKGSLNFKDETKSQKKNYHAAPDNKKKLRFEKLKTDEAEQNHADEITSADADTRTDAKKVPDNQRYEKPQANRLLFSGEQRLEISGMKKKRFSQESEEIPDEDVAEDNQAADSAYGKSYRQRRTPERKEQDSSLQMRKLTKNRQYLSEKKSRLKMQEEKGASVTALHMDSKARLLDKSETSHKLKTDSRYHKEKTEEPNVRKSYQKKLNQQKFMENRQRIQQNEQNISKSKEKREKIAAAVKSTIAVFVAIAAVIVILIFLMLFLTIQFAQQGLSGLAVLYAGTYQSTYTDISDCEAYFRELETDLEEKIAHIKEEYPDCDEYIYNLGNIGHKAVELMSYIATKYVDFTLAMCKTELDSLFEEMYTLTVDVTEEPREKYVTDAEGNILYDEYGNPLIETYMAKICYITLEVKSWDEIVSGRLTEEEKSRYNVYVLSKGAQQVYGSPLAEDWSDKISSRFGYRIHPITKEKKFHAGIDIAVPVGTPLYSCTDGTVMIAEYSDSAGYYIRILTDTGYSVIYMHLDSLGVSAGEEVSKGMVIGATGNTGFSTGPHLHLEIRNPENVAIDPTFIVASGTTVE